MSIQSSSNEEYKFNNKLGLFQDFQDRQVT